LSIATVTEPKARSTLPVKASVRDGAGRSPAPSGSLPVWTTTPPVAWKLGLEARFRDSATPRWFLPPLTSIPS